MSMTLQEKQCICQLNQRIADLEEGGGAGTGGIVSDATGYTGGGPTNLDGEVTVGVAVPQIYYMKHSTTGWRQFLLRAGTDAEASPNIIRPDDYNASTNAKVFELMV